MFPQVTGLRWGADLDLRPSDNLIVLLHAIEKDTGAVATSDIQLAKRRT